MQWYGESNGYYSVGVDIQREELTKAVIEGMSDKARVYLDEWMIRGKE